MRFDDLMSSAAGIFMMVRWKLLQFLWMRFEDIIMWQLRLMRAALQGSPIVLITDRSLVMPRLAQRSFSLKGRMATSCARCDVAMSTRMVRHLVSITDQALCTIIIYNVWLQDENVKQLLCAHCPKCYFELRRQYTPLQEIDERTGSLP